jgi:pimeloyl-ACP methyl ester carboxylesterase
MATIDIDDTTLYCERSGQGPTLLFVHGMCGDAEVWAGQAARFTERSTCVRFDRRGHTRSQRGGAAISTARHADDAAGLIAALGLAPCLLVGSSSGAVIALDVAVRYPQLLRGLVLSEPPLFCVLPDHGQALLDELGRQLQGPLTSGNTAAAVDAFFSLVCPGLWSGIDEAAKSRYRANAEIGLTDLRSPSLDVTPAELAAISLPVLLIGGDASHPAFRDITHRLAEALPDARLVELERCGHVTYHEQPDAFARAVSCFIGEVDLPAGSRSTAVASS